VRVAKRVGTSGTFKTYWLHTDRLDSVTAVTDVSRTVGTAAYGPGGVVVSSTGPRDTVGYINERMDESGLVYLNARYYDPSLGRFITPDPKLGAGSIEGLNRYSYAGNDPVNRSDPSGRFYIDWGIGVGFGQDQPFYGNAPPGWVKGRCIGIVDPVSGRVDWSYPDCDRTPERPESASAQPGTPSGGTGPAEAAVGADSGAKPDPNAQPAQEAQAPPEEEKNDVVTTLTWIGGVAGFVPVFGDAVSLATSVAIFAMEPSWSNFMGMAGDTVGLLPGVPAIGAIKRFSHLADKATDLTKASKRLAKGVPEFLNAGEAGTRVYKGLDKAGEAVYVGITNDMVRRQIQHGERFTLEALTEFPVTRGQARAIEQAVINRNRGIYQNIRNSISPNHEYYEGAVDWGEEWLRHNGL
jgi:RHS repeat-associated protein